MRVASGVYCHAAKRGSQRASQDASGAAITLIMMVAKRVWVGFVLPTLAACSPSVNALDVFPRHACPGEQVRLVWDFSGTGTMSTDPAIAQAPNGQVEDSGSASFRVMRPTKVKLRVTRMFRSPTSSEVDIEMAPGSEILASLADPSTKCEGGVLSTTAHMNNFGGMAVAVVGVAAGNKRAAIDIMRDDPQHPGSKLTAHIAPGAPSAVFAGLPVNGDWEISSPLLADESCSGDHPALPNNLIVQAYTKCNGAQP